MQRTLVCSTLTLFLYVLIPSHPLSSWCVFKSVFITVNDAGKVALLPFHPRGSGSAFWGDVSATGKGPPSWVPFWTSSGFCFVVVVFPCKSSLMPVPHFLQSNISSACFKVKMDFPSGASSYPWVKQFSLCPTLLGNCIRKTSQQVSLELNRHLYTSNSYYG